MKQRNSVPAKQRQHKIKLSDTTVRAVPVIFTQSAQNITAGNFERFIYMKRNWPCSVFIELGIYSTISDTSYYLGRGCIYSKMQR